MQTINYQQEARRARGQSGALTIFSIALLFVAFFALTNDLLRATIATVAVGLFSTVTAWAADARRKAEVFEVSARDAELKQSIKNMVDMEKKTRPAK